MPNSLDITAIFGGIGGLELGLHRSGHVTSLFCECDPEATAVLKRRFPGVPVAPDIKRTEEILDKISPRSDLLTAGFPCTDLSQAGRTRGFAGGRSSLIRETIALLRRRPFPKVLIENVPNWRHLHRGQYMGEVLSALEELGYRWAYRTIDALAFGLPQRRNRIFMFATLEGDPRETLFHGDEPPVEYETGLNEAAHGFYWTEGNRGLGWGEDYVPTLKGGSAMGIPSPPAILLPDLCVVTPHLRDVERLQGLPEGWTDLDLLLEDGRERPFNARRRWTLIGNAVNVEVSTWVGQQLAAPRAYDDTPGIPLAIGEPWPKAAWFDGKIRYATAIGSWPVNRPRQPLAEFLRYPGAALSLRATSGFYKRICQSTLRFKPGFKEAIAAHCKKMETIAVTSTANGNKNTTRMKRRAA